MSDSSPHQRRAGVLLHVTSLPSRLPVSGIGPEAVAFVDWLAEAGVGVWQVLPLVPTHPEDASPYNGLSAMAGNPELVSLPALAADGWLTRAELEHVGSARMTPAAARTLAARRFVARQRRAPDERFAAWQVEQGHWLPDHCAFVALREQRDLAPWTTWEPGLRDREPAALEAALAPLRGRVDVLVAEQWFFAEQWRALRAHAASREVQIFGDVPIFVSLDSSDVWAHRHLFRLDAAGQPTTVTGVPPDYFAADGQMWNNPHYDWDAMAAEGWAWWRSRVRAQLALVDLLRIDHFRGFEAAWHIPAGSETAREGHWEKSPGDALLAALLDEAGPGALVAEDLGVITDEVDALRRRFGLPGMRVLQFAFDGDPENTHLLSRHEENGVVYTGTHDNATTCGWWADLDEDARAQVRRAVPDGDDPAPWGLVGLLMTSVSRLAVVPAQDLLGLGDEARMNTPGTATGNWRWRAAEGSFDAALAARTREVLAGAGRLPG